jgi:AmmeMemoRadiSam system protein B
MINSNGKHSSILILLCGVFITCSTVNYTSGGDAQMKNIRFATAAGRFYPGTEVQLRKTLDELLKKVPDEKIDGEIVAGVAPHAGYIFSGQVAAYTHKLLKNVEFDTIVIIGHDSHIPGVIAFVSPADAFETPLGQVPLDRAMIDEMCKLEPRIRKNQNIHRDDHTIEVQLPFLQFLEKKFSLVPLLFGEPTVENCQTLAKVIVSAASNKKVIVLASTDLSHYPAYEVAKRIDQETLESIASMNVNTLFDTAHKIMSQVGRSQEVQTSICAIGGVGTAICFAQKLGASRARILKYTNSGDSPAGGKDNVVGYGSVIMLRSKTSDK